MLNKCVFIHLLIEVNWEEREDAPMGLQWVFRNRPKIFSEQKGVLIRNELFLALLRPETTTMDGK